MKCKTLAAIAAASLLATSFAFAAPSAADMGMADDSNSTLPPNSASASASASSLDNTNIGAIPNANPNVPGDMASNTSSSNSSMDGLQQQMSPSNDDVGADTTTADDDY